MPSGRKTKEPPGKKHMIKPLAMALVWILMSAGAVAANNAPASDASIRQMLELTNAQQMIAGMKQQMTAMMNTAMQNATRGQTVTPERQAILDRMAARMSALVSEMLNWDDSNKRRIRRSADQGASIAYPLARS
jgi:hypothetical protein